MSGDLMIRSLLMNNEVGVCGRLREAREKAQRGQSAFAEELGISRVRMASYEYAKAPVRYEIGKRACYLLNINQRWLATGKLPVQPYFDLSAHVEGQVKPKMLFTEAYSKFLENGIEQRFDELESLLGADVVQEGDIEGAVLDNFHLVGESATKAAAFYAKRVVQLYLQWLPDEVLLDYTNSLLASHRKFQKQHAGKIKKAAAARLDRIRAEKVAEKGLTDDSLKSNTTDMKSEVGKLIERAKLAASMPGAKAELARTLNVAPARVTEWLAGTKEPGGNYTLQLLKWVEQQERKT